MNGELIDQYKMLHNQKPGYGYGCPPDKIAQELEKIAQENPDIKSVLDFGCGKGNYLEYLAKKFQSSYGYDPAIEKYQKIPVDQVDLVVSTDVFEHLDPDNIQDEIDLITGLNPKYILLNIATCVAQAILPNGMNAHTIVWPAQKWVEFCGENFSGYTLESFRDDPKPHTPLAPSVIIVLKHND